MAGGLHCRRGRVAPTKTSPTYITALSRVGTSATERCCVAVQDGRSGASKMNKRLFLTTGAALAIATTAFAQTNPGASSSTPTPPAAQGQTSSGSTPSTSSGAAASPGSAQTSAPSSTNSAQTSSPPSGSAAQMPAPSTGNQNTAAQPAA